MAPGIATVFHEQQIRRRKISPRARFATKGTLLMSELRESSPTSPRRSDTPGDNSGYKIELRTRDAMKSDFQHAFIVIIAPDGRIIEIHGGPGDFESLLRFEHPKSYGSAEEVETESDYSSSVEIPLNGRTASELRDALIEYTRTYDGLNKKYGAVHGDDEMSNSLISFVLTKAGYDAYPLFLELSVPQPSKDPGGLSDRKPLTNDVAKEKRREHLDNRYFPGLDEGIESAKPHRQNENKRFR